MSTPAIVILIVAGAILLSSVLKKVFLAGHQAGLELGYDLGWQAALDSMESVGDEAEQWLGDRG